MALRERFATWSGFFRRRAALCTGMLIIPFVWGRVVVIVVIVLSHVSWFGFLLMLLELPDDPLVTAGIGEAGESTRRHESLVSLRPSFHQERNQMLERRIITWRCVHQPDVRGNPLRYSEGHEVHPMMQLLAKS